MRSYRSWFFVRKFNFFSRITFFRFSISFRTRRFEFRSVQSLLEWQKKQKKLYYWIARWLKKKKICKFHICKRNCLYIYIWNFHLAKLSKYLYELRSIIKCPPLFMYKPIANIYAHRIWYFCTTNSFISSRGFANLYTLECRIYSVSPVYL